jgi:Peptidase family C25
MNRHYTLLLFILVLCLLPMRNTHQVPTAQASDTLQIITNGNGVRLVWNPDTANEHHEILFEVTPGTTPVLTTITSQITPDINHLPIVDDYTQSSSPIHLGTPVLVRGHRVVVATLQSRVYGYRNAIQRVISFDGTISNVTQTNEYDLLRGSAPFLATSTAPHRYTGKEWRVTINTPGMQKIPATLLRSLGIASQGSHLGRLIIQDANGTMIPVDRTGLNDNQLDTADSLVFYAPPNNDRWNTKQTVWLRINDTTAGGMTTRVISDTASMVQTSAYELAQRQAPLIYEPTIAGEDGDHWFLQRIRTDNTTPASEITISPTWKGTAVAPFVTKAMITGNAIDSTAGPHILNLTLNRLSSNITWVGVGAWQQVLDITGTGTMRLFAQSTGISELLINTIQFARTTAIAPNIPFLLPQIGSYRASAKPPTGSVIYDITDSTSPVIIKNTTQPDVMRSNAPNQRILIVTPTGYNTPVVTAGPSNININVTNVDALYIAPAPLLPTLAALVAYRTAQGIPSMAIDVQQIYDGWSGGQVSPTAIRLFLQYIAATNTHVPHTIALVGDGTVDPFDYSKSGSANINFIPPFLANVDHYMGESACDSCYVRLDGNDPLNDSAPDMSIGRISVRTPNELKNFITKVIRYEQQANAP